MYISLYLQREEARLRSQDHDDVRLNKARVMAARRQSMAFRTERALHMKEEEQVSYKVYKLVYI